MWIDLIFGAIISGTFPFYFVLVIAPFLMVFFGILCIRGGKSWSGGFALIGLLSALAAWLVALSGVNQLIGVLQAAGFLIILGLIMGASWQGSFFFPKARAKNHQNSKVNNNFHEFK